MLLGEAEEGKTLAALVVTRKFYRALERETRALERERLDRDRAWGQGSCYYDNRAPEPSLVHHGFVTAGDIALLGRMHRLGQPEPDDLQLAKKAPLLVIADVSAPHARTEATWALLEARNNSALPSIVTSGDTSARFYERFGNAAASGDLVRVLLSVRVNVGGLEMLTAPHDCSTTRDLRS